MAGHKPNLTKGMGVRGQIDCIDFQSMPDGEFEYFKNYQYHGIKFMCLIPLTSKRSNVIACELVEIFSVIGPPAILQADNGHNDNVSFNISIDWDAMIPHCIQHLDSYMNQNISICFRQLTQLSLRFKGCDLIVRWSVDHQDIHSNQMAGSSG